jgi:hypothetical protein
MKRIIVWLLASVLWLLPGCATAPLSPNDPAVYRPAYPIAFPQPR